LHKAEKTKPPSQAEGNSQWTGEELMDKGAGIQDALWTALAAEILKAAMQ
jgi:hypothetical protein